MRHLWAKLVGMTLAVAGAGFIAGASFIAGGNLTALLDGSPQSLATSGRAPGRPTRVPEIPVSAGYLDGVYIGRRESAYYGTVRVEAVVRGGDLVDVRILSYPTDNGTSRSINRLALPHLIRESLRAQDARVAMVSGATFTSEAFSLSLRRALTRALGS